MRHDISQAVESQDAVVDVVALAIACNAEFTPQRAGHEGFGPAKQLRHLGLCVHALVNQEGHGSLRPDEMGNRLSVLWRTRRHLQQLIKDRALIFTPPLVILRNIGLDNSDIDPVNICHHSIL